MQDKAFFRAKALAARNALSADTRAVFSAKIAQCVMTLATDFPQGPVSLFWPIRSEIDTRPLMTLLREAGFALALPRVDGSSLDFRLWDAAGRDCGPAGEQRGSVTGSFLHRIDRDSRP